MRLVPNLTYCEGCAGDGLCIGEAWQQQDRKQGHDYAFKVHFFLHFMRVSDAVRYHQGNSRIPPYYSKFEMRTSGIQDTRATVSQPVGRDYPLTVKLCQFECCRAIASRLPGKKNPRGAVQPRGFLSFYLTVLKSGTLSLTISQSARRSDGTQQSLHPASTAP